MHRQGEFTKGIGGRIVESACFESSPRPLETEAQRQMFVSVAKCAQETIHLVRTLPGGADGFQRGGQFRFARCNRLEERALELTAARRTFGVDAAAVVVAERSARLGKFRVSSWGFRVKRASGFPPGSPSLTDGQAERLELLRVVARLKFNVLEEHAVA